MKKEKLRRLLKKNCIKIPLCAALILGICFASKYERELRTQTEYEVPATVYEVWAETPDVEPPKVETPVEEVIERNVEEMIIDACSEYGIGHEIPLAISKLETGHFTSDPYIYGNNVGGLMDENYEPIVYETLDEGVNAFVNCLSNYYFNQGLNTVEEISHKYIPTDERELWVETVKELM